jgi:hypothetical protein
MRHPIKGQADDVMSRHLPGSMSAGTLLSLLVALGCEAPASVPNHPTWADVAPILRGECGNCHGWTASDRPANAAGVRSENTGGSYRFDFFDVTPDVCGDAVLALDTTVTLAGSPAATIQIKADLVPQNGARWPRMPPQPSSGLPDWELRTIERWVADPVKGPPPTGNRLPTIKVSQLPSTANGQLAFTAIIDDPDGDPLLGVIKVGDVAFLMNRQGAFGVGFDTSGWPAGTVHPIAVVCDGWANTTTDLGPIEIKH